MVLHQVQKVLPVHWTYGKLADKYAILIPLRPARTQQQKVKFRGPAGVSSTVLLGYYVPSLLQASSPPCLRLTGYPVGREHPLHIRGRHALPSPKLLHRIGYRSIVQAVTDRLHNNSRNTGMDEPPAKF